MQIIKVILFVPFLFLGVRLSGGDTDKLHFGDSVHSATSSHLKHLFPSMDCLAHLLWTLEPHHDRFSLLQSC